MKWHHHHTTQVKETQAPRPWLGKIPASITILLKLWDAVQHDIAMVENRHKDNGHAQFEETSA